MFQFCFNSLKSLNFIKKQFIILFFFNSNAIMSLIFLLTLYLLILLKVCNKHLLTDTWSYWHVNLNHLHQFSSFFISCFGSFFTNLSHSLNLCTSFMPLCVLLTFSPKTQKKSLHVSLIPRWLLDLLFLWDALCLKRYYVCVYM